MNYPGEFVVMLCGVVVHLFFHFRRTIDYIGAPTWSHSHLVASWARWCVCITAGPIILAFVLAHKKRLKILLVGLET